MFIYRFLSSESETSKKKKNSPGLAPSQQAENKNL